MTPEEALECANEPAAAIAEALQFLERITFALETIARKSA